MENIKKLLHDYPLMYRMVLYILLFSFITTVFFIYLNYYSEYRKSINAIHGRLDSLERSQSEVLANSVWTFNMPAVEIQMNSILQNEDIVFLELSDDSGLLFVAGEKPEDIENVIVKEIELYHDDYGSNRHLGSFKIYATKANIKRYLKENIPLQIVTQLIFLILICSFVLILFYFLFNRHLQRIVRFTKKIDIDRLDQPLELDRKHHERKQPDELDRIAGAINDMRERLLSDIIEKEKAEASLRESEKMYREIYNAPNEVIFIHDPIRGNVYDINRAVFDVYGYSREEAIHLKAEDMSAGTPPFTMDEAVKKIQAAVKDGPQMFEWLARHKSGKLFWVEVSLKYVESGEDSYVIAVVRDINARKLAEQKLAEEKERLAVTLRSIGDGVITTDTEGKVVLVNSVAEHLTGWNHSEAAGRPLTEIFHIINERNGNPCENPVKKVMDTGEICGLANGTVLVSKDGSRRIIADSGAPIRDNEGRIIGIVLVFRDVTEKNHMEKERLKIKKLESVGVLAGGIAHDFNNILLAILANISVVRSSMSNDSRNFNLLESAEKATLRAKDLTQQLLTFAKGGEPVKKISSIVEVIRDSAEFVLRGSNVGCNYSFAEGLWHVEIDAGQISQVIQNIIINANEAMPDGGEIKITCNNFSSDGENQTVRAGDYIKIMIEDRGCGMPADVLEKIFDPYFSTRQDGSGLGLAITHSIVTKHDGYIFVDSREGHGSVFTIYLPTLRESVLSRNNENESMPAAGGRRILVMDDEEMIRDIVETILVESGNDVLLARDGAEAIEMYRKSLDTDCPIELIIMDLTIQGGMGGREAVQEILKINPAAKVIVSSGYSNDPVMATFREHGFIDTITKPYNPRDLIQVINRNLL